MRQEHAFAVGSGAETTDAIARQLQTGKNLLFFGAAVGFIFTIDETLERFASFHGFD